MKKRLLVVEDEIGNIDLMRMQLERLNYEVLVAVNGREGVDKATSELPDLIIMDMAMPEMDGYEATRLIRQDPRTRDIPILAVTAHAMKGDKEKCLQAGCDEYIAKPYTHKELEDTINLLLKERANENYKTKIRID